MSLRTIGRISNWYKSNLPMHSVWSSSTNDANRDEEVLTEIINLNASEWRQKTEQFIEIIKTEVLEEKNIQIDVLKKFLISMNKI